MRSRWGDDLCCVAGSPHAACVRYELLQDPFALCTPWRSAGRPVPQGFLCFFGDSGPWAVTGPAPCAQGKFSFQFICLKFGQLRVWPRRSPLCQRLQLGCHWEQDASLQEVQHVGFWLFPGSRSFLGKVQNRLQANTSSCCPCLSRAGSSRQPVPLKTLLNS